MKIFRTKAEMSSFLQEIQSQRKTIGYVATMGALHEGHISLVKKAKQENDFAIVSIFVNPTQFNNAEDLEKYPRTEEKDIALLEANLCDFLYLPDVSDLYDTNEKAKNYNFSGIENVMEGKFRPGHFDGVATIVAKLLRAIHPDKAYFGEKDYQQVRIIQEMVKQENIDVEIIPVPIFRAENGLALSSRNARLSEEELAAAPFIYETLVEAKELKLSGKSVQEVKSFVEDKFNNSSFVLEYFELTDDKTLQPISKFSDEKSRGFVVAYAGDVRLIDNLSFD